MRYQHRESRPEDVEMILELQREVKHYKSRVREIEVRLALTMTRHMCACACVCAFGVGREAGVSTGAGEQRKEL